MKPYFKELAERLTFILGNCMFLYQCFQRKTLYLKVLALPWSIKSRKFQPLALKSSNRFFYSHQSLILGIINLHQYFNPHICPSFYAKYSLLRLSHFIIFFTFIVTAVLLDQCQSQDIVAKPGFLVLFIIPLHFLYLTAMEIVGAGLVYHPQHFMI